MARSINKAILLGNLTRDPVLRYTQSGKPVCDFGIATNRSWTNDKGERQEVAEFHNIVAWGKLAEIASQYLAKGRKVYIEGRLQTRSYDTTRNAHPDVVGDCALLRSSASGGLLPSAALDGSPSLRRRAENRHTLQAPTENN
jgi:single-strand DNA-binding protein